MLAKYPKTRTGIYIVGLAAQVASFFAPVFYPDLAQPLSQTADFLGVIAIGTAVSNLSPAPVVYTEADSIAQLGDGGASREIPISDLDDEPKHRA